MQTDYKELHVPNGFFNIKKMAANFLQHAMHNGQYWVFKLKPTWKPWVEREIIWSKVSLLEKWHKKAKTRPWTTTLCASTPCRAEVQWLIQMLLVQIHCINIVIFVVPPRGKGGGGGGATSKWKRYLLEILKKGPLKVQLSCIVGMSRIYLNLYSY